jgi:hypothetical protein
MTWDFEYKKDSIWLLIHNVVEAIEITDEDEVSL